MPDFSTFSTFQALFAALREGATVVTANRRLARHLRGRYDAHQKGAGRQVWETADVTPFSAWLERLWTDWQHLPAAVPGGSAFSLITPSHEVLLWEVIIERETAERPLLQVQAAAKGAREAWYLMHQWEVDPRQLRSESSDDVQAFSRWADAYARHCAERHWLDGARLAAETGRMAVDGRLRLPESVIFAGFDEFTPQQQRLLADLAQAGVQVQRYQPAHESAGSIRACADSHSEMWTAARWARQLLERRGNVSIGIVVPDLAARRSEWERILREVFFPGRRLCGAGEWMPFNVSLGRPLDRLPMIRTAVQVARLLAGTLTLEEAGQLLLSPYLGGADAEYAQRGRVDMKLRRRGQMRLDARSLLESSSGVAPRLARGLAEIQELRRAQPSRQRLGDWVIVVNQALAAVGWPGDRTLDSGEFQARNAWHNVLAGLAELDAVAGQVNASWAVSRMARAAAETLFQPASDDAPVQVLGMLEAAGTSFDHLWITGCHDEVMPAPARPSPYLPSRLQRQRMMPHASAARELEVARRLVERFVNSAPDLVFSYPQRDGDRQMRCSPLLHGLDRFTVQAVEAAHVPTYGELLFAEAALEPVAEDPAPALADGEAVVGGTAIFKNQAACPFRAFALHRLGADSVLAAQEGLTAAERGVLVHRVLELVWSQLVSQATLLAMDENSLAAVVATGAERAVADLQRERPHLRDAQFACLEAMRLQTLATAWLELEKQRAPFTVVGAEQKRMVEIGGVAVQITVDRVDQLPDGRHVIIDYKTSKPSVQNWFTARPEEPQLPLYSVALDGPVAAVLYAQVRSGDMRFIGLSDKNGVAPQVKRFVETDYAHGPQQWPDLLTEWRATLTRIADGFRAGHAAVDPKDPPKTCANCDLTVLCRITERGEAQWEEQSGD